MSHGSGRTPIRIRIRAQLNVREREDNRFDCAGVRDAQMVTPTRTVGNRCADSSSPGTVGLSTFADSNAVSDHSWRSRKRGACGHRPGLSVSAAPPAAVRPRHVKARARPWRLLERRHVVIVTVQFPRC